MINLRISIFFLIISSLSLPFWSQRFLKLNFTLLLSQLRPPSHICSIKWRNSTTSRTFWSTIYYMRYSFSKNNVNNNYMQWSHLHKVTSKHAYSIVVSINLIDKVFDSWIRNLGFNFRLYQKSIGVLVW